MNTLEKENPFLETHHPFRGFVFLWCLFRGHETKNTNPWTTSSWLRCRHGHGVLKLHGCYPGLMDPRLFLNTDGTVEASSKTRPSVGLVGDSGFASDGTGEVHGVSEDENMASMSSLRFDPTMGDGCRFHVSIFQSVSVVHETHWNSKWKHGIVSISRRNFWSINSIIGYEGYSELLHCSLN